MIDKDFNIFEEKAARIGNASNKFQGDFPRVLAVCSGGILRSPTIAHVLAAEFECNTRCAGTDSTYALTLVDEALLHWADHIVCAEKEHARAIRPRLRGMERKPKIHVLGLPDVYAYRDPTLCQMIRERWREIVKEMNQEAEDSEL